MEFKKKSDDQTKWPVAQGRIVRPSPRFEVQADSGAGQFDCQPVFCVACQIDNTKKNTKPRGVQITWPWRFPCLCAHEF